MARTKKEIDLSHGTLEERMARLESITENACLLDDRLKEVEEITQNLIKVSRLAFDQLQVTNSIVKRLYEVSEISLDDRVKAFEDRLKQIEEFKTGEVKK